MISGTRGSSCLQIDMAQRIDATPTWRRQAWCAFSNADRNSSIRGIAITKWKPDRRRLRSDSRTSHGPVRQADIRHVSVANLPQLQSSRTAEADNAPAMQQYLFLHRLARDAIRLHLRHDARSLSKSIPDGRMSRLFGSWKAGIVSMQWNTFGQIPDAPYLIEMICMVKEVDLWRPWKWDDSFERAQPFQTIR